MAALTVAVVETAARLGDLQVHHIKVAQPVGGCGVKADGARDAVEWRAGADSVVECVGAAHLAKESCTAVRAAASGPL